MSNWVCVHIEHERLSEAVNVTFRNMLISEYREFGEPKHCRVFREFHANGSYSYFFSPTAAETFEALINFWNGFTVSQPTRLSKMTLIVGAERSALRNEGPSQQTFYGQAGQPSLKSKPKT